jgi:phosphoglycerate dehydrogenase-like enzyme
MRALLAMPQGLQHRMLSAAQLERLRGLAEVDTERTVPSLAEADDAELAGVEVLITGWGSPAVDAAALARLPRLRGIVHTAGTVRSVATEAVWEREDLVVTSATEANAVPVAEYALAQILLAGKSAARRRPRPRTRASGTTAGSSGSSAPPGSGCWSPSTCAASISRC